jgi:diguanylate cyclase (GGDEF)-like protein
MSPSKQSEITNDVIKSVVHLTEQRDELTLLRSLLETIQEMLPGVPAALICLVPAPERGGWILDENCALPKPMFPIADWLMAEVGSLSAEAPTRQLTRDGIGYLISSLGIQDSQRKAIVMLQPELNPADLRIAQGMLKIYANFARVLFDSERDTLTGLYNRKKLDQKLSELLAGRMSGSNRERDKDTADYLAVFDIDHFKRINDNFGHLIGDEVLLIFAGLLRNTLRDVDWVFRYGGEEFVALIKGVSPGIIASILERIRVKVQDHPFPQIGQLTVSTGYTSIIDQQLPSYVFEEADKALYYAKEHGRNQVCDYRGLMSRGELAPERALGGTVELFD